MMKKHHDIIDYVFRILIQFEIIFSMVFNIMFLLVWNIAWSQMERGSSLYHLLSIHMTVQTTCLGLASLSSCTTTSLFLGVALLLSLATSHSVVLRI